MKKSFLILLFVMLSIFLLTGCDEWEQQNNPEEGVVQEKLYTNADRLNSIPTDKQKVTSEKDQYPPILHSDEYNEPIPLEIISTAGAEDSPFIPANRDELYFVFIKDVREEAHIQIRDIVNGIWMSKLVDGKWQEPELVILQDPKKLALNGCEFVVGGELLFCSVREGYTGMQWFNAKYVDGRWSDWEHVGFNEEYQVGELHIYNDELYYHSTYEGGKGGNDIWMMKKVNGEWTNPYNVEAVNSEDDEGMPYITPDGTEMWFNRQYKGTPAVYRSKRVNDKWTEPELIISQFAGEPTLDKYGNLYFVHHYYQDGEMIESDIYVAYRK